MILPKGLPLGLSNAAPVGPIGVLTMRRTIGDGFRMGFATGLGAATADATYGLIAALGLTTIMSLLTNHADGIRLIGGAMLMVIGVRALIHSRLAAVGFAAPSAKMLTPLRSYIQTVGLTLTNPVTVITFIGMLAGVGISSGGDGLPNALALVTGVGLGSAAWWLFLAFTVSRVRLRLSGGTVRLINIASTLIITGFGVVAVLATA
jgi:threonine/homoserine/homoserine lactone efflux protein